MKNSKWLLSTILVIALMSTLAACGGEPQEEAPPSVSEVEATTAATDTPPPTDTPIPTDTPMPTDTPQPEPAEDLELDTASLAMPDELNSYRSSVGIVVEGTENGEEIKGTIQFMVEYTSEPLAQHVVITGEGFEGTEATGSIEMFRVGDTAYVKFGEDWLSMPVGEDDFLTGAGLFGPDELLGDTCGWNKERDTEYNGVKVHHWTLSKTDAETCMTAEQLAESGELTDLSGNLYVAVDGNYPVAMDLVFEGKNLDVGMDVGEGPVDEGRMEFTFEMIDVNEPFVIEVPEEALASGAVPEDIPIPDDAEEVSHTLGLITFMSPSSPEEVADFYKAEMPQNGWTEVSADEFSGTHMLEYSKDNRKASVMINTDSDSGKTSVLITVEGDEQ